jgi:hypothetical protein
VLSQLTKEALQKPNASKHGMSGKMTNWLSFRLANTKNRFTFGAKAFQKPNACKHRMPCKMTNW